MGNSWAERAGSFDSLAEQYDAVRPGYPEEAIDAIVAFGSLSDGDAALEIGCGTGKATRRLCARGLRVTAVEPGAQLIEVARRRCGDSVRFHHARFEDWALEEASFDLAFAAQSFHWVDPSTGYRHAGNALRPGGTLALFWNRARRVPGSLETEVRDFHASRAPASMSLPPEAESAIEQAIEDEIAASGLFDSYARPHFPWADRCSTDRFVALLETYSGYSTLEDSLRLEILAEIRARVEAAGGEVEVHYDTVIHLARRCD